MEVGTSEALSDAEAQAHYAESDIFFSLQQLVQKSLKHSDDAEFTRLLRFLEAELQNPEQMDRHQLKLIWKIAQKNHCQVMIQTFRGYDIGQDQLKLLDELEIELSRENLSKRRKIKQENTINGLTHALVFNYNISLMNSALERGLNPHITKLRNRLVNLETRYKQGERTVSREQDKLYEEAKKILPEIWIQHKIELWDSVELRQILSVLQDADIRPEARHAENDIRSLMQMSIRKSLERPGDTEFTRLLRFLEAELKSLRRIEYSELQRIWNIAQKSHLQAMIQIFRKNYIGQEQSRLLDELELKLNHDQRKKKDEIMIKKLTRVLVFNYNINLMNRFIERTLNPQIAYLRSRLLNLQTPYRKSEHLLRSEQHALYEKVKVIIPEIWLYNNIEFWDSTELREILKLRYNDVNTRDSDEFAGATSINREESNSQDTSPIFLNRDIGSQRPRWADLSSSESDDEETPES